MSAETPSFTRLLNLAGGGDERAAAELLPMIYDELRSLARARIGTVRPGDTLQPTALVHEAYLRLFGKQHLEWKSRAHFFAAAAQTIRNILVDRARQKASLKRGGARRRAEVEDWEAVIDPPADDVLALDEALRQLEQSDPRKARLVLLHCFGGLTLEETASALEVSLTTAEREWRFTRALLRAQLEGRVSGGN
jgi:RNA polymerase sigma factor (TIGR02999 family)